MASLAENRWLVLLALLALVGAGGFARRMAQTGPPRAGWVVLLLTGLAVFGATAWQVVSEGSLVHLDVALATWLQAHRTDPLTGPLRFVTVLHNPIPVTGLMVIAGLALLLRRDYRWLVAFVITVAGGTMLNVALKHLFTRARLIEAQPILPSFASFSFPSGHVAASTLLYGFVAVYLMSTLVGKRARQAALALSITMIVLVAFGRMYLGAHYLSDVIAAAAMAGCWLTLSVYIVHGSVPPTTNAARHRSTG